MYTVIIVALASVMLTCGCAQKSRSQQTSRVVELPRPNSGAFTTEQAEAKRHLILANDPSPQLTGWKNPFLGFAVHVNANDTFTVYSAFGLPERDAANETLTVDAILELQSTIPQFGNPHGVLITSDLPLGGSKTFPALLDALFVPRIQIFYLSTN